MATEKDELIAAFQAINVKIDGVVLNKCLSLCDTYWLNAETFIDEWMAFTASYLNGAPPSLDTLDALERKELQKMVKMETSHTESDFKDTETIPINTTRPEIIVEDDPKKQYNINYSERNGSRSVLCTFGNLQADTFKKRMTDSFELKMDKEVKESHTYLFDMFSERGEALCSITSWLTDKILQENDLKLTKLDMGDGESGEMVICGRILASKPGKLDPNNLVLEGRVDIYRGEHITLVTDTVESLALFKGQIAVVRGSNLNDHFVVKQFYTTASLPKPEHLPNLTGPIQVVVAVGPYTCSDNLLYEPLEDLLKYVVEFKPNLLVLMGPFLDTANSHLAVINEEYQNFFEDIVGNRIMETLKGTEVQVVLIPSDRDLHIVGIFPNLPYVLQNNYANLTLATNPCMLEVNGLIIGATSMDVLFHLNKVETFRDLQNKGNANRMGRLASYLLHQRSFYPLHPPDMACRIDYRLFERYGLMKKTPHLLLLPSNLHHFIKRIDNTLVINPERLVKGQSAGTFTRIEIRPGMSDDVLERTTCEILQI